MAKINVKAGKAKPAANNKLVKSLKPSKNQKQGKPSAPAIKEVAKTANVKKHVPSPKGKKQAGKKVNKKVPAKQIKADDSDSDDSATGEPTNKVERKDLDKCKYIIH